jgi:aldehyde dehydrogenase (NAD+)
MIEKHNFYIGGAWVMAQSADRRIVLDPSNEEEIFSLALGNQEDTDAAVAAARAAFPSWSATDKATRLALMQRILEVYNTRIEDLAQALCQEMGAPISLARSKHVPAGSYHMQNYIDAYRSMETTHTYAAGTQIQLDSIGVCALITPWNWPLNQITLKVMAALAAGCTMVLKPSEMAPLNALIFAEILEEAGVPAGVFNLINGDGMGVGTQLSMHADVDMISFTGSSRAGISITKTSAITHKRVCLELGGKGANIIFADADADAVARGVAHCFNNTGQSCNAPSRMFVQREIYEAAIETATSIAKGTFAGPAIIEGPHIGPVVSKDQFKKVQTMIQAAMREGARLVAGGMGRPGGLNIGYFVKPTVFVDVTPEMVIAREEVFGPVLTMTPFDTEEEAIAMANDTKYGLTNYVQTADTNRARRVAMQLRSGVVEINGNRRAPGAPFGGVKHSGKGREGGVRGIEEFLEAKTISGL